MYPIVNLRRLGVGARVFVEGLEDAMVRTAGAYGVSARVRRLKPLPSRLDAICFCCRGAAPSSVSFQVYAGYRMFCLWSGFVVMQGYIDSALLSLFICTVPLMYARLPYAPIASVLTYKTVMQLVDLLLLHGRVMCQGRTGV